MKNKPLLVVLTGAGMSAESGISTFRDANGLWENHKIEDVASPSGWIRNPELVLQFYNQRRKQLLEVEPNEGHYGLQKLEEYYDVCIITQNVDNLHERAGSKNILHLHGELTKARSTGPGAEVFELEPENYEVNLGDCCPKAYQLRPHIVWFGEDVPEIKNAIDITIKSDIFLIIGTSLNVYPAAGLINYLPSHCPIYLIDPQTVIIDNPTIKVIKKGAVAGIAEFTKNIIQI